MDEREAIRKMLREDPERADWLRDLVQLGKMGNADDLPDDELVVIAAGYTTDINGSKQVTCGCGKKVWISPSTQELLPKHPNHVIACTECVLCMAEEGLEQ